MWIFELPAWPKDFWHSEHLCILSPLGVGKWFSILRWFDVDRELSTPRCSPNWMIWTLPSALHNWIDDQSSMLKVVKIYSYPMIHTRRVRWWCWQRLFYPTTMTTMKLTNWGDGDENFDNNNYHDHNDHDTLYMQRDVNNAVKRNTFATVSLENSLTLLVF